MAVDLPDGEFLLPSQFLTDDDIILEKQHISHKGSLEARTGFTWEISNGFGSRGSSSALSSPVESEMGSTDTESEEEDYIAELTRRMAHYMLQEDDKHAVPTIFSENTKSWDFAGSPQSTLWSPLSSNRGIPKGPSQELSPPRATPINGEGDTRDLPNNEGPRYHHGQRVSSTTLNPTPSLGQVKNPNGWTQSNQALTHDQLRAILFYQLKQKQLVNQQGSVYKERRGKACGGFGNGRSNRPLGLSSSAWSPLQQQQNQQGGSGMRAIFLRGSGSRSGSCGTGVFLPPGIVNSSESRKKPGCSTVLIPARVVQALNLHFDNMGALPRNNGGGFPLQHEASSMGGSSTDLFSQQKRHTRNLPRMNHHEMGLPQDWTY